MKKLSLFICLLISFYSYSQEIKDTIFTVRGYNCNCKYPVNSIDDSKKFGLSQASLSYYPGGEDEWKKFVKKTLNDRFRGKESIQIRFDVDKNGDASNFILLTSTENERFEEIVRMIKVSGKWFPAIQGGYCVKSIVRLMIDL